MVMDWSYSMLTSSEGRLFARLSVFAGDFSLQAAEEICQGESVKSEEILGLLAGLVDQSLVQTLQTLPEARFRLHEIARQYAHQKLQTKDNPAYWQDRHLDYFVNLADEAEPELRGRRQLEWITRLELEQENIRTALRRSLAGEGTPDKQRTVSAVRLVNAIWVFWFIRGWFNEGHSWAKRALAALERSDQASPELGNLLYVLASFYLFLGELPKAVELSHKSLVTCKAHNDLFGQAMSYYHLGVAAEFQGNIIQAGNYFHQGHELATHLGDLWLENVFVYVFGDLAVAQDDIPAALKHYQYGLDIARQMGDTFNIIYRLGAIAEIAIEQGDTQQAQMLIEEGLRLSHAIGEKRMIAQNLGQLGLIAMHEEQYERADQLLKQSLQVLWATRDRRSVTEKLVHLADNAFHQEKFEFAARLLAACEKVRTSSTHGEFQLPNQGTFDQLIEEVRTQLDGGIFTAAWTLGGLMSLRQAVAFALADPGD